MERLPQNLQGIPPCITKISESSAYAAGAPDYRELGIFLVATKRLLL